jgi:hypothetical protein
VAVTFVRMRDLDDRGEEGTLEMDLLRSFRHGENTAEPSACYIDM